MNTEQKTLLELARSALLNRTVPESLPVPDWNELYPLISDSKLSAISYDAASSLKGKYAPPEEIMREWKDSVVTGALRQMKAKFAATKILAAFTAGDIPCVVFKGPVLADLYMSSAKRFSKDLDILVAEEHRSAAEAILREYHMQYFEDESKDCVSVWNIPGSLQIELHTCLWEDYQGEQVERLKEMRLTDPGSLVSIESSVGPIVTMGHTEHLVYQMFHTVKHLLFKGISLRVFTDTTLFINRYIEEIDVERFWQCMDDLKYTRFCMDMFRACEMYFDLDIRIYPPGRRPDTDPEDFLTRIMDTCLRKLHDKVYNAASNAVFHTFLKESESAGNNASNTRPGKAGVLVKLLFPSRDFLPEMFAYAKKHPVLLPVAWVHRAVYKLLFERGGSGGFANMQKSLSLANRRTSMLQEYELLE